MARKRRRPPNKDGKDYAPQIAFRLDWDVVERLDEMAAASGIRKNRSDLIREAIDLLLEQYDRRANKGASNIQHDSRNQTKSL